MEACWLSAACVYSMCPDLLSLSNFYERFNSSNERGNTFCSSKNICSVFNSLNHWTPVSSVSYSILITSPLSPVLPSVDWTPRLSSWGSVSSSPSLFFICPLPLEQQTSIFLSCLAHCSIVRVMGWKLRQTSISWSAELFFWNVYFDCGSAFSSSGKKYDTFFLRATKLEICAMLLHAIGYLLFECVFPNASLQTSNIMKD